MNDHLRDWLATATNDRRRDVAAAAKTTVGHLWQLAGGHRKASAELAERLQDASGGEITIAGLRPDLIPFARKALQVARPAITGTDEANSA
ncbi:hypothetical protein [Pseudomonas xanthosomatis]|uniref:hypothetical protein n=1 Tax=Pseudomonas TaxID=286 RepID=UPI0035199DAA